MMAKIFRILPLLVLATLLSSCVDYVQSVSVSGGKSRVYCKLAWSRPLVEMSDLDAETALGDSGIGSLMKGADVREISTEYERGREFTVWVDKGSEEAAALLPKSGGGECRIPFLIGSEAATLAEELASEDEEGQAIKKAMLSSAKCRVIVDKKIAKRIVSAHFERADGDEYEIPVYDYGPAFCMEIPYLALFEEEGCDFRQIVAVTK